MKIAIFADVHGRILLAFKIVERYQRETGETVDVILQCGDVGIFPDATALDKATRRIAEHDETELGFAMHFANPSREAEAVLDRVSCMMIGMREISTILDRRAPAYHFFGHTGQPFQRRTDQNGVTVCSKLSDFEWEESDPGGRLKEGCLGILRWQDANHHRFDVVDAPWIREYTPHTWQYL